MASKDPNQNPQQPDPNKDAYMTYKQYMNKQQERDAAYSNWVMKQGSNQQKQQYFMDYGKSNQNFNLAAYAQAHPEIFDTADSVQQAIANTNPALLFGSKETYVRAPTTDQSRLQTYVPGKSLPTSEQYGKLTTPTPPLTPGSPVFPEGGLSQAQRNAIPQTNTPGLSTNFWENPEFKDVIKTITGGSGLETTPTQIKIGASPTNIPIGALPNKMTLSTFGIPSQMGLNLPSLQLTDRDANLSIPKTVELLPSQTGEAPQPFELEQGETTSPLFVPGSPLDNIAKYFNISVPVISDKYTTIPGLLSLASAGATWARGAITAQPNTNVLGDAVQLGWNTAILIGQGSLKGLWTLGASAVNGAWDNMQGYAAQLRGDQAASKQFYDQANQQYLNKVNDLNNWAGQAQVAVNRSWNNLSNSYAENQDIIQQARIIMKERNLPPQAFISVENEVYQQRNQTYREEAVRLTSQAQAQYTSGDVQGAVLTMQQAIQARINGDPTGQYGAYSWVREADRLDAFTKNVAYVELQKGAPLTDGEIQSLKDHYANSWTEMAGEMVFDPMWLVPQKIWDLAFEPIKFGVKFLGETAMSLPVIGDVGAWMTRQTSGSVAGRIFRSIDEFWGRFAKSYNTIGEVIADTSKLEDLAREINVKQLNPDEAEALFQESKQTIPGLNQFGHYSDFKQIVDLAGNKSLDSVGRWSTALQQSLDITEQSFARQAEKDAVKELGESARGTEAFRARVTELTDEYMGNTKYINQIIKPFGGRFTDAFLDPRRIYNYEKGYQGLKLLQDSGLGRTIQLMREFAGQQLNEKVLPKFEELGPLGKWMREGGGEKWLTEHGFTLDSLLTGLGESLGTRENAIRSGVGSLARGIEGAMSFTNKLRDMWATMVLSWNPSWVIRKYADLSLRHFVYGGSMWDDLRALNLSLQREMEDQVGQHFDVFAESIARTIPQWEDKMASRFQAGWKPGQGPFQAYSYFKYAYEMRGEERAAEIASGEMQKAGIFGKFWRGLVDVTKAVPDALQDYTTALEYTFRLRALHDEYFKALEILEPKVLDKILGGTSPELQDIMRMAWKESDSNPEKLSQIIKSVTGSMAEGKANWSVLVPPNLKDSMPNMTLQDEALFVKPVRDALQEYIHNIQLAGHDVTVEDVNGFFRDVKTRLQNEIQANAAQQYGEKEISTTLNTTGEVSKVPTTLDGPHPVANPTKVPTTPRQAVEAAQKISASRFPLSIEEQGKTIENFTSAISPIANVERIEGGGIKVVLGDDGKPIIQIGRNVTDLNRKTLYSNLLDATMKSQGMADSRLLHAAGISNSDAYVTIMRDFITDPAKLAIKDEKSFVTIADQLAHDSHYLDMVERLSGQKINYESILDGYRKWNALPEYEDGIPATIRKFMNIADADVAPPFEIRAAGVDQAISTRRVGSLIADESLPAADRQQLQEFLNRKTNMQVQLEQMSFHVNPGPKNFTGNARKAAWNLYYRRIADNYRSITSLQNEIAEAFVKSPADGRMMLNQLMGREVGEGGLFTEAAGAFEDNFLKEAGIWVDWNPDHTSITNVTITRNGRDYQNSDPEMAKIIHEYFYSDYAHRTMNINQPIKVSAAGQLPLMEQARIAVRNTMEITNEQAGIWARVMDTEAKNWANDTGRTVDEWYESHGFQKAGAGGPLTDAKGLVRFQSTAVGKSADGTTMLYGLASANKEDLVNSTSTIFYNDLVDRASKGSDSAMESLKRVKAFIEQETGQKVKANLTSEQSKLFADQFKTYIARGDVSNVNLIKPFNEMKSWLSDAYTSVEGSTLEEKLSPDIKSALDQMLYDSRMEPPKGNARQIQIMAKDMGIQSKTPEDLKAIVDAHYAVNGPERERIADEILTGLKGNKEQADATMRVADSMAQYWSRQTGRPASEWYGQRLAGLRSAKLKELLDPTMLRQSFEEINTYADKLVSSMQEKASPEDLQLWQNSITQARAIEDRLLSDPVNMKDADIRELLNNQFQSEALLNRYGLSTKEENPVEKFVDHFTPSTEAKQGVAHNMAVRFYKDQQAFVGNKLSFKQAEAEVQKAGEKNILSQLNMNIPQEGGNLFTDLKEFITNGLQSATDWHRGIADIIDSFPLFQDAKGAMTVMPDGKAMIHLFQGSDVSTIIHELAHTWRQDLNPQDLETVAKWTGLEGGGKFNELRPLFEEYQKLGQTANKTAEQLARMKEIGPSAKSYQDAEEKFARGFERYLSGGHAPTEELKPLFQKFREWLLGIYNAIKGSSIDVQLSPKVRGIFDNLLTSYIPAKYPTLGDVAVGDAQRAFNFFNNTPNAPAHALSDEVMGAWKALVDNDPVMSSLPDHAKIKPDAMKMYLQNRIQSEHPETASMYRDALWRVEQVQDSIVNFHKGTAFQDTLYPAVNLGKMDTGVKTWIAHRNYQLAHYDQAFNALDIWNKFMNDAVDNKGTVFGKYTQSQVDELSNWAKSAATAKGNLVSSILNGGNVEGTQVSGAVDKVNQQMVDYQYTNNLDQTMKNIFPFWKFPSRSWPFWAEAMLTHPEIIATYNKLIEASESQLYQSHATTSGGLPRPSMIGYFNVPGTDLWYNPAAPFSAKYALDYSAGLNNRFPSNIDPNAGIMDSLTQQFMEEGRLYGFSPAPWLVYALQATGKVPDNIVPRSPLVPQINLIPRYWVNDMIRMARQINLPYLGNAGIGGFAQGAEDMIYPDVQGSDYLVENRILSDVHQKIQNPNLSDYEKAKLTQEAKIAISQKGDNNLWISTYQEVSQETEYKNLVAYFTGIYPKQFTGADADLNKIRDMNTMLKSAMNNELQAKMFDIPTDPTARWNYYKAYQSTPDGLINRIYSDIGWVPNDQGQIVDEPKQRATLLALKLQNDSNMTAYFNALDSARQELQNNLRVPVGSSYNDPAVQKAYRIYNDQLATITKLYPFTYQRSNGTNQPVELIQQNITNQWYYLIRATEPTFDHKTESYPEYQARIQQWYNDMPNFARELMLGHSPDTGFMNSPAINDITGSLHSDQPLGPDFFTNLMANTNYNGMQQWDLANDNIFEAVNKAYNDMYYKSYWAAITLQQPDANGNYYLKDPERELALYDWSQKNPVPTADDVNNWVQQMYPGRFDSQQVKDWVNTAGVYSVQESENSAKGPVYQQQQGIWDMLSWGGPDKGSVVLGVALTKIPGIDGDTKNSMSDVLNLWVSTGGTLYADQPDKLAQLYNAVVQAAQSIDLQPPNRDQILEYIQAKQHNDEFKVYVEQKLGTAAYNQLFNGDPSTGTLSLFQQAFPHGYRVDRSIEQQLDRNFKLQNPAGYKLILEYYHLYDIQTGKDPLWAKYYGPSASSQRRMYIRGAKRRNEPFLYYNPNATSDNYQSKPPITLPPSFESIVGTPLITEINNLYSNQTPLSNNAVNYLQQLVTRHPEWDSFLKEILNKSNFLNSPVGGR